MSNSLRSPGTSLPGSSVHGISQARKLEWVAISFSRGSSQSQGLDSHLLHWQMDSSPLSHQGCPPKWLYLCKNTPPARSESSIFSTSSPTHFFFSVYDYNHSSGLIVLLDCVFNLHFLNDMILNIFKCAYFPFLYNIGEVSLQALRISSTHV